MKKFIQSTIVTLATVLTFNTIVQAQTGPSPFIRVNHDENNCEVYVDQWDYELGLEGSESAEVYISLMPNAWLKESMVRVRAVVNQEFTGEPQLFYQFYSESTSLHGNALLQSATYSKAPRTYAAGEEIIWHVGQYYEVGGVWDGVPGDHETALIEFLLVSPALDAQMFIDVVQVYKYDTGPACWAN